MPIIGKFLFPKVFLAKGSGNNFKQADTLQEMNYI